MGRGVVRVASGSDAVGAGDGARRRVTIVLDPRFPGGTAAAVAGEIRALCGRVELSVIGLETSMLPGREVNPRITAALEACGLPLLWHPPVVRGDIVIVHNPAALKFDRAVASRISCAELYVVTHENLLRPNGSEGFDVAHCLDLLAGASVAGRRWLVPVSATNRSGVAAWLRRNPVRGSEWMLAPFDWPNVFEGELRAPAEAPRDRRGRHSRPGFEKFPPLEVMRAHFPAHADACVILGADAFLADPASVPRHWRALPFGAMEVDRFFDEIDFFVYFTHPLWSESFGRAIAEAIAAGKLVITDARTASHFGPGVVTSDGRDVDALIRRFVADPGLYRRTVRQAQAGLASFRPEAAADRLMRDVLRLGPTSDRPAAPRGARERRHALL